MDNSIAQRMRERSEVTDEKPVQPPPLIGLINRPATIFAGRLSTLKTARQRTCDVRAGRDGDLPLVHDRSCGTSHERHAEHRPDGVEHGVDPAPRRIPDRHPETGRRQGPRLRDHPAHVPVRHRRLPDRVGVGRRLVPTTPRPEREPEEVVGRVAGRHVRHRGGVGRLRHVLRRPVRETGGSTRCCSAWWWRSPPRWAISPSRW